MRKYQIPLSMSQVESFCHKWKVKEFSLFGSVLREEFCPDSDVDVLVSFQEDSGVGLWEMVDMLEELEKMFGRKVDLVEKEGLQNPYRRQSILESREILYAA